MLAEAKKKITELARACGITDAYQHEMIFCEDRSIICNKARGVGITSAISFQKMMKILIPEVWLYPQTENVIMSASDEQAQHILSYIKQYWKICQSQFSTQLKIKKDKVEADNGSWIMSLACSPDSIRSWHGDAVFDEFAFFKNEMDYDVYKAVSGVLTSGGQVHYISTPNGERGKFFEIWDRKDRAYKKFKLPYTSCFRDLYRKSVMKAKKELLDWEFEEEYMCSFAPKSKGALPIDMINNCVKDYKYNEYTDTDTMKYAGIDFAKLVDETALVYLEKLGGDVLRVIWADTTNGDYAMQEELITDHASQFNFVGMLGDRTGGGIKVCEDLEKVLGCFKGYAFTSQSKDKMFHQLKDLLMRRKLILPAHDKLIKQLSSLQRKVTNSGVVQYSGKHDDFVWALCLAIEASRDDSECQLEEKIVESQTAVNLSQGMYINNYRRHI